MSAIGIHTTAGSAKTVNQDACCFKEAATPWGIASMGVVCDGVGGMEKGEFVSSTIVWRFADWFENDFLTRLENDYIHAESPYLRASDSQAFSVFEAAGMAFVSLLNYLHDQLNAYAQEQGTGFGSTFTGMLLLENNYCLVHVGDSRAYQLQDGKLHQLTTDHSLVADLVRQGTIVVEEAREHPKRNVITKAVGVQKDLDAEVQWGSFEEGTVFILCSDGFYKELTEHEIVTTFSTNEELDDVRITEAEHALTQRAIERGEKDNITVLVFSPHLSSKANPLALVDKEDGVPTIVDLSDSLEDTTDTVVDLSGSLEDTFDTVVISSNNQETLSGKEGAQDGC